MEAFLGRKRVDQIIAVDRFFTIESKRSLLRRHSWRQFLSQLHWSYGQRHKGFQMFFADECGTRLKKQEWIDLAKFDSEACALVS